MKFSDIQFDMGKKSDETATIETANPQISHDMLDTHNLIEVECGVHGEPSVTALADVERRVVYPLRKLPGGK